MKYFYTVRPVNMTIIILARRAQRQIQSFINLNSIYFSLFKSFDLVGFRRSSLKPSFVIQLEPLLLLLAWCLWIHILSFYSLCCCNLLLSVLSVLAFPVHWGWSHGGKHWCCMHKVAVSIPGLSGLNGSGGVKKTSTWDAEDLLPTRSWL